MSFVTVVYFSHINPADRDLGADKMDGFLFVILIFSAFSACMAALIFNAKGKRAVYLTAIAATLSAWFTGLILDANIGFEPAGFLSFRMLLPILAMGLCILNAIMKSKPD